MRRLYKIAITLVIPAILTTMVLMSCRKDLLVDNDPSIMLEFSNDSVIFDTVFTSLGSVTKTLMVYNRSKNRLKISDLRLGGGGGSFYRLNVDGQPGNTFSDVEINGGDSIYIFTRVTIDPNDLSNPYIVEDSILFQTNGNEQQVRLVAWGQNANYIVADTYTPGFPRYKIVADSLETTVWSGEKPYVIYGYAVINSYGELRIEEGTRVLFHKDGGLWAYVDGVLKVNGTLENPVYFGGDRLEEFYGDIPGQWDRIWLMEGRPGHDHEISHAIIENGFIGIQAESFQRPTENRLLLHNVIIQNMTGVGLFSRLFYIEGSNTVMANCGGYTMALTSGGVYDFKHSTFANYWSYNVRNTPAVYLNNFVLDTNDQPVAIPIDFSLGNGIIYGYNQNEFETEMVGGADSLYYLDHCILKIQRATTNTDNYFMVLRNQDPLFLDDRENDYRIDTLSPAIGYGDPSIAAGVPFDILDNSRAGRADLGAYQFMPGQNPEGK